MAELFDSLPIAPALRTFVRYLIAFCSRQEAASDVVSGPFVRPIVPDKLINYRDPRLNRCQEIRRKAVGYGIFISFSKLDKCRSDVAGDVISASSLECVCVNVRAKLGISMLNSGRIIRLFGRLDQFHALLRSI